MAPKTNTKSSLKSTQQCGSNDFTNICPEVPFGKDAPHVEIGTLACFAKCRTYLYIVRFLMLGLFSNRPLCFSLRELSGVLIIFNASLIWPWGWSEYRGVFEYWGVFGVSLLLPYQSIFANNFRWGLLLFRNQ